MKKKDVLKALETWYEEKSKSLEEDRKNVGAKVAKTAYWSGMVDETYQQYSESLNEAKEALLNSTSPLDFAQFLIRDYVTSMWEVVVATENGRDPEKYSTSDEFVEILFELILKGEDWEND